MSKEKKPSAFMKPVHVKEPLTEIVGHGPMPRTEVTKKLWDYIKKHGLQDGRKIKPDAKLAKILGSSSIDMFEMTRKVSKFLSSETEREPARTR